VPSSAETVYVCGVVKSLTVPEGGSPVARKDTVYSGARFVTFVPEGTLHAMSVPVMTAGLAGRPKVSILRRRATQEVAREAVDGGQRVPGDIGALSEPGDHPWAAALSKNPMAIRTRSISSVTVAVFTVTGCTSLLSTISSPAVGSKTPSSFRSR